MIDQELLQELEDNECLLADGFDDALVGITEGSNPVSVYDTDKCIEVLMRDHEMNHEDSLDYFYPSSSMSKPSSNPRFNS